MKVGVISDCHLGSKQFKRRQRFFDMLNAFEESVSIMIENDVDIVLISGDLFDSATRTTAKARGKAINELMRLNDNDIKVFAINGNHDIPGASPTSGTDVEVLDTARVLTSLNSDSVYLDDYDLEIRGQDYIFERGDKDVSEEFKKITPDDEDSFSILMMHQSISGIGNIPEDVGMNLDELPKDWDIIINGHHHTPRLLYENDDNNNPFIVFPGSTERYSMNELGVKKVVIIEIEDNNVDFDFIPLDSVREFISISIDCDDLKEEEIYDKVSEKVVDEDIKDSVVRIVLNGSPLGQEDIEKNEVRDIVKEEKPLYSKVQDNLKTKKEEVEVNAKEKMNSPKKVYIDFLEKNMDYSDEEAEELSGLAEYILKELEEKNTNPNDLAMDLIGKRNEKEEG